MTYNQPNPPFFIFAEDLSSALIGPFDTFDQAKAHVDYCIERGDGAHHEIITNFIMTKLDPRCVGMTLTPKQDKQAIKHST